MSFHSAVVLLGLLLPLLAAGVDPPINWNGKNWAFACDFNNTNNRLSEAKMAAGDQCGPTCERTPDCTHFTWASFQGGICWMKKGKVTKADAQSTGNRPSTFICGVLVRNWGDWSDWSSCDAACGDGSQTRTRSCGSLREIYNESQTCTEEVVGLQKQPCSKPCNIMVFAGFRKSDSNLLSSTEVISISNPNSTGACAFTPELPPYTTSGFVNGGAFFKFQVVGCGGFNGKDVAGCSSYDKVSNIWKAFTPFTLAQRHGKMVLGDNNTIVNTGGYNDVQGGLYSILTFGQSGKWHFSAMPITQQRHCLAPINETHVMSVGGSQGNYINATNDVKNVMVINWKTGSTTFLPALDRVRIDPVCGIVTRADGIKELIVAGGSPDVSSNDPAISTLIYPLDGNPSRPGPYLPVALMAGQSLAYSNNTFLHVNEVIVQYDVENDDWITLPQKMVETKRRWFGAALVPQDYVTC